MNIEDLIKYAESVSCLCTELINGIYGDLNYNQQQFVEVLHSNALRAIDKDMWITAYQLPIWQRKSASHELQGPVSTIQAYSMSLLSMSFLTDTFGQLTEAQITVVEQIAVDATNMSTWIEKFMSGE